MSAKLKLKIPKGSWVTAWSRTAIGLSSQVKTKRDWIAEDYEQSASHEDHWVVYLPRSTSWAYFEVYMPTCTIERQA